MKISKAAEFLKKAVRVVRGKAGVFRAKLLFLASLRHRTAMVATISRHIREVMPGRQGEEAVDDRGKAVAPSTAEDQEDVDDEQVPAAALHGIVSGLSELLQEVVDDDGDGCGGGDYPDWTHSLFDDEDGIDVGDDEEEERSDGEAVEEELGDEEPSVIDVIRRRREGDGLEFNMEEEIDLAADMFIRRVRSRMNNRSF